MEVAGPDGSKRTLRAKNILVATGEARPPAGPLRRRPAPERACKLQRTAWRLGGALPERSVGVAICRRGTHAVSGVTGWRVRVWPPQFPIVCVFKPGPSLVPTDT